MVSATGYSIFTFSLLMATASLIILAMSTRWRALRAMGLRLLVVFSVATLSGGYVWLQAGPQIDFRMQAKNAPLLLFEPPAEVDA